MSNCRGPHSSTPSATSVGKPSTGRSRRTSLRHRLDQIASTLAVLFAGRVFVEHNASVDRRFVQHSFGGLGHDVPLVAETTLCTMHLASSLLPDAPRNLQGCCESAGIALG